MGGYFLFWILGIPAGILLKMVLIRIAVSTLWWIIGALFFVLCVIWGMIPQIIKDVLKGILIIALITFCISCFF